MTTRGSPLSFVPVEALHQVVMKDWERSANKTAIIYKEEGERTDYTFCQLKEMVHDLSRGLHHFGIRRGDVILIFSTNNVEFYVTLLAAWTLGATVTMANVLYTPGELSRQIDDARATYMIGHQNLLKTCEQAAQKARINIKNLIVIGNHSNHVTWASLLTEGKRRRQETPPEVNIDPEEDVAVIPYSSGTTGLPKGVMLTHRNVAVSLAQYRTIKAGPFDAVQMVFLPLFHMSGLYFLLAYTTYTNPSVLLPRFESTAFFKCIQDFKVAELLVVPPIAVLMYKSPLTRKYDLSCLKRLLIGAAPLKKETQIGLSKLLKDTFVFQAYGMTEAVAPVTVMPDGVKKPGSVGIALPDTEIRIRDLETGIQKQIGEAGEVWLRGPQIMKGYMNQPKTTAPPVDKEGWYRTGDVGYLDADGYLYIVDRVKEMIKYKAFQVAPAELEALLLSLPGIEDAGVVGVPDKEGANELPTAFVVQKDGHHVTEKELHDYVNENVAPYKRLRGGIHFVPVVPRTASGKVLRRKLREMTGKLTSKI